VGLIHLDACLVIQLVARAIVRTERARFGVSPLVKCEGLLGAIKRGDPVLQGAYRDLFDRFASLGMPERGLASNTLKQDRILR
jgi:hypothetical protein